MTRDLFAVANFLVEILFTAALMLNFCIPVSTARRYAQERSLPPSCICCKPMRGLF